MGIYRIFPSSDTFITDGRPANSFSLTVRGSGSSHGKSPALNVFARKDEITSGSIELARSLLKFDLTELSGMIFTTREIVSSSFFFKVFDQIHEDILPSSYELFVYPLSRSWDEGNGIDDDNHSDDGFANWKSATSTADWVATGSDFITNFASGSQHFDFGNEDLEVNLTKIVNEWLSGTTINNNGVVIKLGDTEETNSQNYYRKSFHGRESLFIDKLPYLEARWNDVLKDNRGNFVFDVTGTLVLRNFVKGQLTTLPSPVVVQVKDSLVSGGIRFTSSFGAAEVSTGVFTASVVIPFGAYSGTFYDVWTANGVANLTGTFNPTRITGSASDINQYYVASVRNLKRVYREGEKIRFGVNVRKKDFVTHYGVMATASLVPETEFIEKMYYSVVNDETGEVVIPFGTGSSLPYTQLSYDSSGNYFDLYLRSFVPGFKYRMLFLIDINNDRQIIDEDLVFKVK